MHRYANHMTETDGNRLSALICVDLPRFTGAGACRGRPDGNCRTRGAGAAEDNLGRAGNVRGKPWLPVDIVSVVFKMH